ncbi:MAG: DNA/RNA non-specific endonuclease [Roseburia sp.]
MINRKPMMQWMGIIAAFFVCGGVFTAAMTNPGSKEAPAPESTETTNFEDSEIIPPYEGNAFVTLNGNFPYFTEEELAAAATSYESYAALDELGRCGVCVASVGQDLMPTEERGAIGTIKPTGWHTVKYSDVIGDNYLYNRCHLLAYQLTGENANEQNLITGTRYLNMEGMLPFENRVAEYVTSTGNHVLYRVTPVFEENNLVASGVRMEAQSVEDEGAGVCFHVYCYNVQPGIKIDYADGSSEVDDTYVGSDIQPEGSVTAAADTQSAAGAASGQYAVNSKNGKIHIVGSCSATGDGSNAMSSPVYFDTYEEAEAFSRQIVPELKNRKCGNCWQ